MPIHDWTRVEAGIFHHFHSSWVGEIAKVLNTRLLPATYYALAEQVAGEIGPDVLTLQLAVPAKDAGSVAYGSHRTDGPVALATAPPRARLSGPIEEKKPTKPRRTLRSVVIRHISNHRIVALVEIISPGNKSSRDAFRACLRKAVTVLRAGIHLMIVDLFPPTRRDPQGLHAAVLDDLTGKSDFTLPPDKPLTLASYIGGGKKHFYANCLATGDMLPEMPLFLDADHYVPVPLESTYLAAWDALPHYWQEILEGQPT